MDSVKLRTPADPGYGKHDGVPSGGSEVDAYFSADIETDGPIPGPYSMLSFALVYAGSFDGTNFDIPESYQKTLYIELKPISDNYQVEAMKVNGLNRDRLSSDGQDPVTAMSEACRWVKQIAGNRKPVLVAYPLSFDWSWLYWYFINFSASGSPFDYSMCFDIKTAYAVKGKVPISRAGRSKVPKMLQANKAHTHHALDDAIEQAELFAKIFQWDR